MTRSLAAAELAEAARALSAEAGGSDATQLDWLGAPVAMAVNKHDAEAIGALGAIEAKRRAGRPKGAENLSGRQLRAMIDHAAGGNVLLQRARWLQLEPEAMALRLGVSVAEAFDRQDRIRAELARYVAPMLAPTDDQGRAVVPILMQVSTAPGARAEAGADAPPWADYAGLDAATIIDIEENQGLGRSRSAGSDQEAQSQDEKP